MNEPQVVTEQSSRRRERLAGLFVLVATLLLLAGFAYYIRHTAARKGWFVEKCRYHTYVQSAEGLNVGDPIMLMGFSVGEISGIEAMPPGSWDKVFVTFEIKQPYYGYIWEDSRVRIRASGFLGQRQLEVTTGVAGKPTVYEKDKHISEVLISGKVTPIAEAPKGIFIKPLEEPALTERAEKLVAQVEKALPNILSMTNGVNGVLTNASGLLANLNATAAQLPPVISNVNFITTNLRDPHGSLGEWLIPTNLNARLDTTLGSANTTITNANQQLTMLATSLETTLINLANITSNLNTQVQANDQILAQISRLVVDSDNLVQGLKKHWLLRGIFKKENAATNAPPAVAKPTSPR